ncbi:hypothetical protein Sjap_012082 [Stephania japonica]|uniref:Tryptophan synthase beta chain-like PALP domain-containing protein n=1 Tax=Stephania japonica TaxID=461633 RepID=A0AAP0IW21_9MAGN
MRAAHEYRKEESFWKIEWYRSEKQALVMESDGVMAMEILLEEEYSSANNPHDTIILGSKWKWWAASPKVIAAAAAAPSPVVISSSRQEDVDPVNIAQDVTQLIGNTPMVYLNKVVQGCVANVAAKLESMQPCRSVKDRIGLSMISDAEQRGAISPAKVPPTTILVEPTSGNTGLAIAFVGASKGYKVIVTMPASINVERRLLLRAFGAHIVLTHPAKGIKGAVDKAKQIVQTTPNAFMFQQFDNPANAKVHFETTGPEIWEDTMGAVDIFVAGIGTGGTITGTGRYLKMMNRNIKVSELYDAHLSLKPTQFISYKNLAKVSSTLLKRIGYPKNKVSNDEAVEMARKLVLEEGLLVGISSGAAAVAALALARRPENTGKLITVMFPSFGERYLPTVLFHSIHEEMRRFQQC